MMTFPSRLREGSGVGLSPPFPTPLQLGPAVQTQVSLPFRKREGV